MYINCHTYYSIKYGLLSPKNLVAQAVRHGIRTLALTDINNTSCVVEFIEWCRMAGIKPVVGIEFRQAGRLLYIGIARSDDGFSSLCRLLDQHTVSGATLPVRAPDLPDTCFIYDVLPCQVSKLKDHEFLGIRKDEVYWKSKLLGRFGHRRGVMWHPVTLDRPENFSVHRILRAISSNKLLSMVTVGALARQDEFMISPGDLVHHYKAVPVVLRNTEQLLESCEITLGPGSARNVSSFLSTSSADRTLLQNLVQEGRQKRFPVFLPEVEARIDAELQLIGDMHFEAYFLTTWDIIRYAKCKGYAHVGRGSGANSIVAYCLGITDVDPIELNLYFERFINPHRNVPPDFDIDFSWKDRDDVLKYVAGKHGNNRVSLLSTYSTFKGKSMVRELGKVFGLSRADMDLIIRRPTEDRLHHPVAKDIFRYGRQPTWVSNCSW